MIDEQGQAKFWSFVDRSGDCWLWTSWTTEGYGQFYWQGQHYGAHRLAWELANGPIPTGLVVCHDCDRKCPAGDTSYRRCVNPSHPSHLFLGTTKDNMVDASRKGRLLTGDQNWSRVNSDRLPHGDDWRRIHLQSLPRGTGHHKAKINENDVREMRRRYAAGGVTTYQLANEYGLTATNVQYIIRRQTWRHVE